jgi:hypothetical protein
MLETHTAVFIYSIICIHAFKEARKENNSRASFSAIYIAKHSNVDYKGAYALNFTP